MATDSRSALRAELLAAIATIDPQIRGLHDIEAVSISDALRLDVQQQSQERENRRTLVQAVLNQLDSLDGALALLEADGYPTLPQLDLPDALFAELQGQLKDIEIAAALFSAEKAAKLTVNFGQPVAKPPTA
jgi:hypothetical protein